MIEVRDISRRFGSLLALDHVSFRVEPGEIVALLGPNGAGKTTASRIIAGILAPSEGDVLVDGISVRDDPNAVRRRCGFVTDQPALYDRMTLRAYLTFFGSLYEVPTPGKRAMELAIMLGLADRLDARLGSSSARSSSARTTSTRRSGSPIVSPSSTAARSCATAPPTRFAPRSGRRSW